MAPEMVEGWATPHLLSSMPAAARPPRQLLQDHTRPWLHLHVEAAAAVAAAGVPHAGDGARRRPCADAQRARTVGAIHYLQRQSRPAGTSRRRRMRISGPRRASTAACSCSTSTDARSRWGVPARARRCATGACGDIGYTGTRRCCMMKERTCALSHSRAAGTDSSPSATSTTRGSRRATNVAAAADSSRQPARVQGDDAPMQQGRPPACDECRQGVAHLRKGNRYVRDPADPQGYSAETLLRCCCESSGLEVKYIDIEFCERERPWYSQK